ncbi:MAG TPA: nitroreductase family deazaflavin-dependent oxidoreductase [Terriglobales bacterium]|nr:nitroreductase family deazaflavin-dependent oxidoreductase [Terriglobales bacterium]
MPKTTEPDYLYLTTTGRRTGLAREIEIWFTRRDGLYYVIAEYPTSQWVQNVSANANVAVRLGEERFAASVRVIDPAAEPALHAAVQQLSREKYGWGDGVVVELQPRTADATKKE